MNNRIIKFRAWDKKEKKMIEVQEMYFNWKEEWVVVEGYIDLQDFELVQYTGLKDKNGKEIYEGDIVRGKYGEIGKVSFGEGCFGIISTVGLQYLWKAEVEVIGNIYQNPELLTIIN